MQSPSDDDCWRVTEARRASVTLGGRPGQLLVVDWWVVGVNGSSKGCGGGVEVTIRGIRAVAELGGRAGASSTTMTAGGRPGQLLVVVWRESMGRVGAGAEDS